MSTISVYTKFFLIIFANGLLFFTLPDPLTLAITLYFCSFQFVDGRVDKGWRWVGITAVFALGTYLAYLTPDNLIGHYILFFFVGIGKLLPVIIVGAFISGTTKVSELIYTLRKLHLPQWIVIPVSVLFRFFPTVRNDYRQIRKAMKFRGIATTTSDMVRHPIRTMEFIYVPLLNNATNVATDLASASLTRGLTDPGPKSSLVKVKFTPIDGLMCLIGLILMGGALYVVL